MMRNEDTIKLGGKVNLFLTPEKINPSLKLFKKIYTKKDD